MRLIFRLFINALAVFIAAYVLPGVAVDAPLTALIVAVALGVVNTFLKPILVILTLPITFVTLGLFLLVINGGLVLLVDRLVAGFVVDGFLWALLFSLVVSLIGSFLNALAAE